MGFSSFLFSTLRMVEHTRHILKSQRNWYFGRCCFLLLLILRWVSCHILWNIASVRFRIADEKDSVQPWKRYFHLDNNNNNKKPNQFLAHRNRNQIDWESLKIGLPLVISLKPGKVAKLVTHCHSRYFDRKVNAEGDFVESFCRLLTENALTLKWLSQANCRFHVVPS